MNQNTFPRVKDALFTERECILHSLIEDILLKNRNEKYILNMFYFLDLYKSANGEDDLINFLFMKYLKKVRPIITLCELKSEYHIACACFNQDLNILNLINLQRDRMNNGENIKVLGIQLSNIITQEIFKYCITSFSQKNYFNKNQNCSLDNILKLIQNKQQINFYAFKDIVRFDKDKFQNVYEEFNKNIYQYLSLDFWGLVSSFELITNFLIIANDPFKLNAGACLSFKCRRIKVQYDISKINLPKTINEDIKRLICYQIGLRELLEYHTESNEIKSLCSIVYLLYLEKVPIDSLMNFINSMNSMSYIILILVYSNYIDIKIPDSIIISCFQCFISSKQKEFLLLKYLFALIKSKTHFYSHIPDDLLYIAPKSIYLNYKFDNIDWNSPTIALAKKLISHGRDITINEQIKKNEDFRRFIEDLLKVADSKTKKMIILEFKSNFTKVDDVIENISLFIDEYNYSFAVKILSKAQITKELIQALKKPDIIGKMKKLLNNITKTSCTYELLEKLDLLSILNYNEKYNIFFNYKLTDLKLFISRDFIIKDSIKELNKGDLKNRKISIKYVNEFGSDAGGLARDWFSTISEAIKETGVFVATPNGDKLTFNEENKNDSIMFLVGQLIGLALSNKLNINLRLASFIWKKLLNHSISIDDMKDYDVEIYNSLKWILENDINDCSLTFVNSNDVELIEGGKDIEVNNSNKKDYIKLIIEDKFDKEFSKEIEYMLNGFKTVIGNEKINLLYSAYDLYDVVNGKETIDINDWRTNTDYNFIYKKNYDMFFNVISKWSMEKQQKLLKFVTGSSQVPIDGFKDFNNRGGLFILNFIEYQKNRLPSSHTCSNHLDIPLYSTHEELDKALSYAIECDDFGFY